VDRYPSQEEAQLILDARNALEGIHIGYASYSLTACNIQGWLTGPVQEEWERVFNSPETSPWKVEWTRNRRDVLKAKLIYREEWSKDHA